MLLNEGGESMLFTTRDIVTEAKKATAPAKPGKRTSIVVKPPKKGGTDYTDGADDPVDDGTQDDSTDYTDQEMDADPTDTPDDTTDTGDTTDNADDTSGDSTDYTQTQDDTPDAGDVADDTTDDAETPEDANKKLGLLTDFIQFYRNIKDVIEKIADTKKPNLLLASVLNQVNKNLGILEENVFQFIYRLFPTKKYVENLYQYNCFIEAFKINIEMLKKIKYLDIG